MMRVKIPLETTNFSLFSAISDQYEFSFSYLVFLFPIGWSGSEIIGMENGCYLLPAIIRSVASSKPWDKSSCITSLIIRYPMNEKLPKNSNDN